MVPIMKPFLPALTLVALALALFSAAEAAPTASPVDTTTNFDPCTPSEARQLEDALGARTEIAASLAQFQEGVEQVIRQRFDDPDVIAEVEATLGDALKPVAALLAQV